MKKALILSGIYWNDSLQRHQQFATYLSKLGYEVYFIEHIISSKFSLKKALKKFSSKNNGEKIINSIPNKINVVNMRFLNPEGGLFSLINKYKITKLINSIGTEFDITINYLPINTTRWILEKINTKKIIYDCVRNFENWPGYRKDILEEEKILIKKSDAIFTDSYFLTEKFKRTKKKIFQFLPIANDRWNEGCSISKEIINIKNIGYFGSVGSHLDIEIFKTLVKKGYKLHIWGILEENINIDYIYHGYFNDLSKLSADIMKNVDAIILPYPKTMDGVIPAKILQCLKTFLPIFIGTFYDSKKLNDFLYVYESKNELLEKIRNFNNDEFLIRKNKIKKFIGDKNESNQFILFNDAIREI